MLLCFPYGKSSKFRVFPAKNQVSSDAKLSKRLVQAHSFFFIGKLPKSSQFVLELTL